MNVEAWFSKGLRGEKDKIRMTTLNKASWHQTLGRWIMRHTSEESHQDLSPFSGGEERGAGYSSSFQPKTPFKVFKVAKS